MLIGLLLACQGPEAETCVAASWDPPCAELREWPATISVTGAWRVYADAVIVELAWTNPLDVTACEVEIVGGELEWTTRGTDAAWSVAPDGPVVEISRRFVCRDDPRRLDATIAVPEAPTDLDVAAISLTWSE